MAKDKEKQVNPATAALRAAKNRAVKKGKADVAAKRSERLAQINPAHLSRKIQELKDIQESGGSLKPFERQRLDELEKQLRGVEKARKDLGDKAPQFRERREWRDRDDGGDRRGPGGVLGKRRRGGNERYNRSDSSDTDENVQSIPMPKDEENMPPVPRRRGGQQQRPHNSRATGANSEPLDLTLPGKPGSTTTAAPVEAKQVYSSAPVMRNLTKESVTRFMPAAVAQKMKAAKGEGGLLEPEELDRLEKLGYLKNAALADVEGIADEAEKEIMHRIVAREVQQDGDGDVDLDAEERMFQEEMRRVEREDDASTTLPSTNTESALRDARKAADEAGKEAEFEMMADEAKLAGTGNDTKQQAKVAESQLRQVEMEEVSDEDL